MRGVVIGNGLSREGLDLTKLTGVTLGCNKLYKEFEPDYLVALDVAMIAELNEYTQPRKWKWISRRYDESAICWITLDGHQIIKKAHVNGGYNNNSGVLAAAYAVEVLDISELYLVGIDFFRHVPGRDNDITGGNYPGGPGLTAVWNRLIEHNPQCRFVRVGPIHDRDRHYYYDNELEGFEYISYEEFEL